jgi:hypothetical protein
MSTHPILYLVACSAAKSPTVARARDLYTGQAFKFARAVVEAKGAEWQILSAKHGLLDPASVVEPYDVTLSGQPATTRRAWGARVAEQLFDKGFAGRKLVFLAGANYVDPIMQTALAQRCFDDYDQPLAGLGIGYQLGYLKNAVAELQVAA